MIDLSKLRIQPTVREQETDPLKIFALRTQRGTIEGAVRASAGGSS